MTFRFEILGESLFVSTNIYRHPVVCCDKNGRIIVLCNRSVDQSQNCVIHDADGNIIRKTFLENLANCYIHAANFDTENRLWVASDNTVYVFQNKL